MEVSLYHSFICELDSMEFFQGLFFDTVLMRYLHGDARSLLRNYLHEREVNGSNMFWRINLFNAPTVPTTFSNIR